MNIADKKFPPILCRQTGFEFSVTCLDFQIYGVIVPRKILSEAKIVLALKSFIIDIIKLLIIITHCK